MLLPETILTQNLHFRLFDAKDAQNIFQLDSNPNVMKYLGNHLPKDVSESQDVVASVQKQYESFGVGRMIMQERRSGKFMGWAGIKYESEAFYCNSPVYDIGYRMLPEFWGRGYATEAARFFVKYALMVHNIPILHAAAHQGNIASQKVLQKSGFQFVDTFSYENLPCNYYSCTQANYIINAS